MKRHPLAHSQTRQHGFILVVALLFMLLIIIAGLVSSSMSNTQLHISANAQSRSVALQSADATLQDAFNDMMAGQFNNVDFAQNANGYYSFDVTQPPAWQTNLNTPSFWQATSTAVPSFQGGSLQTNSYVVEKMPAVATPGKTLGNVNNYGRLDSGETFRITARGQGPQGNSAVVLQAIIAK